MSIGIRNALRLTTTQSVTSSTVLVDATGMTIAVAANQKVHIRCMFYFTVGAAGGVKAQIIVPAGGTAFSNAVFLVNTVAPAVVSAMQTSSAAFADALANAGSHYLIMEVDVINGATAGNIKLQFAQNSSNGTACQLLAGSFMDCVTL